VSVIRLISSLSFGPDSDSHLRRFLTGLKTVASIPSQAQRSFLARSMFSILDHLISSITGPNRTSSVFLGEMNEKDQRKRAIHFVDCGTT
jgi:hypothetical protein